MTPDSTSAELRFLLRSAQRLQRLHEIHAPTVLFERERRVLLRRIEGLPAVSPDIASMVDELERMPEDTP